MLSNEKIKSIITAQKLLPEAQLADVETHVAGHGISIESYLINNNILTEEKLYQAIAQQFERPFVDLKDKQVPKDVLDIIPSPLAVSHGIVAFEKSDKEVKLATTDPLDLQTFEFLRRTTELEPIIYVTTPASIAAAQRNYHESLQSELKIITDETTDGADSSQLKKIAEDLPIINIVNSILDHAVYEGASDIHIEPVEKEIIVRFRIDGLLRQVMTLPKAVQAGMVARVKILANLKLDEHMLPQDGRFKISVQNEKLSLRVSIMPVYDGEKIVMRLLPESTKPLTLEQLGFGAAEQKMLMDNVSKPHGMVLVTGPTGSGKSTTLYSLLHLLNKPDVNISTIEDPIEYHLTGINQSQVNPRIGYTFASGLRAFLRQDPDVIMVGEIRDQETAETAMHAAMTGHLVLATLHTNDAPTTLPRLIDMGVPPFLVAFTTNIIIAQRLVRKICQFCKQPYQLSAEQVSQLEHRIQSTRVVQLAEHAGVASPNGGFNTLTFVQGKGCDKCRNEGYKGRIGIYELLEIDKEMIDLINKKANAEDIRVAAVKRGMITLLEDGIIKALQGVTSIEEILSAAKD
ncbi:MAG: type II/IV secretion system protein [Candidatus Magasanikbacteria bacterium]|nr:type II/IV secretion system protein [Candidatus Magasanikbacteria bacterium]